MHTAEDMFQEGFLSAFRAADSFRGKGEAELFGWLRTIMVNTCLMKVRKRDLIQESADIEDFEDSIIDEGTIGKLDSEALFEMISSLPAGERTVFNLFVFEEMSHKDIAKRLGITERASISKMYRAKALLTEMIQNKNDEK